MKLVNVRLNEQDARAAARLRAKGISISEVVRRALRAEDSRSGGVVVGSNEVVANMLARFPTPKGAPRKRVSAVDRRAVQKFIRAKLRART